MFPPPQENNLSLGASKPTPGMLSTEFTKLHSVNAESRAPAPPQAQDELLPTHVDKGKGKPGSYRTCVVLLATYVYIFGICAIFALSLGSIHEWFGFFRRLGNRAGMIESRKSFRLSGIQGELGEQWPGHDEWTSKNCENSWDVRRRANAWSDATANITLNPYTRSHLLVAQHTNGHVTFTVNPQNVEHILVSVFANFHPAEEFSGVKVCKIGKADGSEGIGFSISEKWISRAPPQINYWATVYLPRQSFKDFETDMPFWSHTFEDLRGEVKFDYLKLKSSPSPIVSRGLSANRAYLTTTDSAIGGQFRVYEVLNLETRYGGIFADVEMLYHPYSSHNKSALYMKSESGLINATTKLRHARERDKGSTGGTYNIKAFSARRRIELKVLDSPLLSQLDLHAQSSYSNRVILHPSYEGSFSAETGSRYDREIRMHQYGPNEDPTGEGRARAVSISKDRLGVLEGNAYWSYENRDKGTVVVKVTEGNPDPCRTGVRLFAVLVFVFGLYSLFGLPFGIIGDWSNTFRRQRHHTSSGSPQALDQLWAGHEDWTSESCENSWTVTTPGWHRANTNITLNSLVLSHLLVAARDTSGFVTFTVNPENVEHILVNVDAVHYAAEDLSAVKVCRIGKVDGSEGIGFSISKTWRGSLSRIIFAVKVYLPRKSFNEFETDLPSWSQAFEDIRDDVSFDCLKLKGSIFEISSKGISARQADVKTTDGAIAGKFQTYEELRLETGNGRITADVEMFYHAQSSNERSRLYMTTQTGVISSTARLLRPTEEGRGSTGGVYENSASSSIGEINVEGLETPLLSQLTLHSETLNSPNRVVLLPSYEGSFAVELDPTDGELRMHKYGPPDHPKRKGRGRYSRFGGGELLLVIRELG